MVVGSSGIEGSPITIKKAIESEHGEDDGWDDSYDSLVVLDGVGIVIGGYNQDDGYDYITIDGVVANGIKIDHSGSTSAWHNVYLSKDNRYPSNEIVLRNLELIGPGIDSHVDNSNGIMDSPVASADNSHTGPIIQNCNIYDFPGAGIVIRNSIGGVLIENNLLHDFEENVANIHEDFIIIYDSHNGVIKNNTCYDTAAEGIYFETENCSNWEVYNNLLYQTRFPYDLFVGTKGISASGKLNGDLHDFDIHDNTVIGFRIGVNLDSDGNTVDVYDNIIYNNYKDESYGLNINNFSNLVGVNPLLDESYAPYPNSPACGTASDGGDIGALPCVE